MAPRQSTVVLVRHGPSAHVHRDGWINAAGMERWRAAYDEAGIAENAQPPQALIDIAAKSELVVASDLQRAIASAELLAPERPIVVTPLLRESALEIPKWLPLSMPLPAWDAIMTAQWGYQILRGTDARPEELKRAGAAATWLTKYSEETESIVVVTHGVFRRLLAQRLIRLGWEAQPGRQSYDTWSAWTLKRTIAHERRR